MAEGQAATRRYGCGYSGVGAWELGLFQAPQLIPGVLPEVQTPDLAPPSLRSCYESGSALPRHQRTGRLTCEWPARGGADMAVAASGHTPGGDPARLLGRLWALLTIYRLGTSG